MVQKCLETPGLADTFSSSFVQIELLLVLPQMSYALVSNPTVSFMLLLVQKLMMFLNSFASGGSS
jgi:hypothetical protein